MKKPFKTFMLLLAVTMLCFVACNKAKQEEPASPHNHANWSSQARKVIYHAEWDDWGRTSRDCRGFGLCHFSDCWFCEVNAANRQATVEFDDETREGYLILPLDPNRQEDASAIQNHDTLYVDENIDNPNSILHKGAYLYDASVGTVGGYKVAITIK